MFQYTYQSNMAKTVRAYVNTHTDARANLFIISSDLHVPFSSPDACLLRPAMNTNNHNLHKNAKVGAPFRTHFQTVHAPAHSHTDPPRSCALEFSKVPIFYTFLVL